MPADAVIVPTWYVLRMLYTLAFVALNILWISAAVLQTRWTIHFSSDTKIQQQQQQTKITLMAMAYCVQK